MVTTLTPRIQQIHRLDEKNYITWSFVMQYFLSSRNLYQYVDGSSPRLDSTKIEE